MSASNGNPSGGSFLTTDASVKLTSYSSWLLIPFLGEYLFPFLNGLGLHQLVPQIVLLAARTADDENHSKIHSSTPLRV